MMLDVLDAGLEISPYPGLRPFRGDEAHLYFGREQHRGELLKRLTATHFVAVIGTSGSGKSSLIRAGLLPDVLNGYLCGTGSDWVIVESTPGADPLGRLAAALAAAGWPTQVTTLRTNSSHLLDLADRHLSPGQHLLVMADQFEELFRLKTSEDPVEDADEKAAFVRLLLSAGGQRTDVVAPHPRVHVVMAMRSEFLGRASVYRGLPEAIDQGQYLIPRLSRQQLRKAIDSPARVAGGEIDEALIQRVLNELGDDQDQLPVLQHALMRCWQHRDGADRIGLDAYEKSGQLATALSLDANEALAETRTVLGDRGEEIVKRAFQALRETDVNGGQTRRPTTVEDLCELAGCTVAELTVALAPFRARSFVVPPPEAPLEDSTLVDISHEALLRRWDMLTRWISEDETDRTRYRRLATRAAEEEGSARPQYLVPPLLDLLAKFWADRNPPRAWAVRHHKGYEAAKRFLDESLAQWRAVKEEEAAHLAEEMRQQQALADVVAKREQDKLKIAALAIVLTLLVLMLAGGIYAWLNAVQQGRQLEASMGRLEASMIGTKVASVPEANIEARLQLAAEAARRLRDPESLQELLRTLFIAPIPKTTAWPPALASGAEAVAVSSGDQRLYAVAGGMLHAIDLSSGKQLHSASMSTYPQSAGNPLLLIAGEKLIMLGGDAAYVVDRGTLGVEATIAGATAASASADGSRAAFLAVESVILCNLNTGCRSRAQHDVTDLSASDLELSADGKLLVIIGDLPDDRRQIALFDTMPWKERKRRPIDGDVESLAMRVDALYVHLCSPDTLRQYDAYDDTLDERVVREFGFEVTYCRIFGDQTVTTDDDGALEVWDGRGTLVARTQAAGPVEEPGRIALGEGWLVTASDGVQAWEPNPFGRQNLAAMGFVRGNAYAYGNDRSTRLYDLDDSNKVSAGPKVLSDERALLWTISYSLGLAAYLRGKERGSEEDTGNELVLVTLRPGAEPVERWHWPADSTRRVAGASISPDDRHVAVAVVDDSESDNSSIVIVDAGNGQKVDERKGELAAFSPDGRRLAVSRGENSIVDLFEWPGLRPAGGGLRHAASVTSLSFRSDGLALVTSTAEGITHVWDLVTGGETLRIPPPGLGNTSAVFTPNGRVAVLDAGVVTVLPTDPDDVLAEACRRVRGDLTKEDWELFVGANIAYQRTCENLR